MGNCLSANSSRPSGESGGRGNGQLDNSVNVVGVGSNAVGIHGGLSETTVGGDPLSHSGNTHQPPHYRINANALPPPPDSDNNSQVSDYDSIYTFINILYNSTIF